MRLSEAIALGSAVTKQYFGNFVSPDGESTCALGAAALSIGAKTGDDLYTVFPWAITFGYSRCPVCSQVRYASASVTSVIAHLNDTHRWTRERIADWVRTIEPPEAEVPLPLERACEAQVEQAVIYG